MTTSIKKLLLALVTSLLAVSFGVNAQTNYNFSETWTFTTNGTNYSETLTGTFTTNSTSISGTNSYLITGWNNVQLSGTLSGTATSTGTLGPGYGSYNPITDQFWNSSGGAVPTTNSTAFLTFGGITNPYGDDRWQVRLTTIQSGIATEDQLRAYQAGPYALQSANNPEQHNVSVSGGSLGGAPEIDGSLAPQVGFLLGCLFLMFGRKRRDLAPVLTA